MKWKLATMSLNCIICLIFISSSFVDRIQTQTTKTSSLSTLPSVSQAPATTTVSVTVTSSIDIQPSVTAFSNSTHADLMKSSDAVTMEPSPLGTDEPTPSQTQTPEPGDLMSSMSTISSLEVLDSSSSFFLGSSDSLTTSTSVSAASTSVVLLPSTANVNLSSSSAVPSLSSSAMSLSLTVSSRVSLSTHIVASSTSSMTLSSSSHLITPSSTQSPTPSMSSAVVTTPAPPVTHTIRITETNFLLKRADEQGNFFIELTGSKSESMEGLFLIVRNASDKGNTSGLMKSVKLNGNLDKHGFNKQTFDSMSLDSVVVALYSDEASSKVLTSRSLVDCLLLSTSPEKVDPEVSEVYNLHHGGDIYIDLDSLKTTKSLSMSFCKGMGISGFVLSEATMGKPNNCSLNVMHLFQMKLTLQVGKAKCATYQLPSDFNKLLSGQIVSKVNRNNLCGITSYNVEGMKTTSRCKGDNKEIAVKFDIRSKLGVQEDCFGLGYNTFVNARDALKILDQHYLVSNCSNQCFTNVSPSSGGGDNNVKVTVAVVVTCVCVFLVILLVVIVYMRKNRRGALQFRMTRLDEEDDDLVGDMDDFVGNQRATFSSFR